MTEAASAPRVLPGTRRRAGSSTRLWWTSAAAIGLATIANAAELSFAELTGWWSAEPVHNGQSSTVYLQFIEEDGKQVARLGMLAIGGFDTPFGTVTLSGDDLDMQPYPWPLAYDREHDTLNGFLPEATVPVHRIAVQFRRIDPPTRPASAVWKLPRPVLEWSTDLGSAVWAGLALDRNSGLLFVGTDSGQLVALATADGAPVWRFTAGGAIRARPTVAGADLYVPADDGYLYKLVAGTGRERWRAGIARSSPPRIPTSDARSRWDFYASSALVDGERLYIGSRDGSVRALRAATGSELWRIQTGDLVTSSPALHQGLVLFAGFDGSIRAVSRSDGEQRWQYDTGQPVPADLVLGGDLVLAGSRSYDLLALDARTGAKRWGYYYWFSWVDSAPVVAQGIAYLGSSDASSVFAIDVERGRLLWQRKVPGLAWAQPVLAGNRIVAVTTGHGSYRPGSSGAVLAIDRSSGAIDWLEPGVHAGEKLEWGFGSAPAADERKVYAADLRGRVYALRIERAAD